MEIPVYQVTILEYKFKNLKNVSNCKKVVINHFGSKIPKVYLDNKPDFEKIGSKVDICLKKHFLGKKVAIRVLGSQEHKGKSVSDLIKIIKKLGHDRYDFKRKGDRYENIENKKIDFFALPFKVKESGKYFEHLLEPFYLYPPAIRGCKPVRVDIAIVYDFKKLKVVPHQYKGREGEIKKDGFVFKYPDKKSETILGIIKIK